MKIESLKIENFRQFWKPITLTFSTNEDKNVTVIHGANGAGKTSLLNAFKWCFYGETDFDTENEFILNEASIRSAAAGDVIKSSVQIKCIDGDRRYEITRIGKYLKGNDGLAICKEIELTVDVTESSGATMRSQTPESTIESLIPRNLQPYFFFNGERIEKIASVNEGDKIKQAIRHLTGLELIERAQRHTEKAARKIRRDGKDFDSDRHQELYDEIGIKEEEKSRLIDSMKERRKQAADIREQIDNKNYELKKVEKAKSLAEKREVISNLVDNIQQQIKENFNSRAGLLDTYRASILSSDIISDSKKIIEENRKIGQLPYKVRDQFVKDLLEQGRCMCGTSIVKGSEEYQTLLEVLKDAGSDDAEETFTGLQGFINHFENDLATYREQHEALCIKHEQLVQEKRKYEDEITEINLKLREVGLDNDRVAMLESEIQELQAKEKQVENELGRAGRDLETLTKSLEERQKQFDELESKKEKHGLTSVRYRAAKNISKAFADLNEVLTDKIRLTLSERVNQTFKAIMRKPVDAIIDENYHLKVVKDNKDGTHSEAKEQSTGEKQVTSLSFIASIIELAKEQLAKERTSFFTGGIYPLVMDSPFGALDDDYRFKVAEGVSSLADQVIIFVSNSQWSGNVKKACKNRVGRSYKLVYHTPQVADSKLSDLGYIAKSDHDFDYSAVEEVI
ncbi:AAA family ATPase [Pseudidiomarina sp.]|uniref:AAA family ATPase n=1 Tax=Pseudidiomarina sp. TaxID=2081707 RepID=UPI003A9844A4